MKHIVTDEKSAVKYIQMILKDWEVWQTHHTGLVEAMKILLSANKKLTDEVDRLKLSLAAETERSESRKEADISEILELRLKVEEVFEEIEKSIANLEYRANTPRKTVKVEELKAQCDWILHEVIPKTLAELKKKYIGDKQRKEDEGK